VFRH
jgi:hypothetical protein